MTHFFRMMVLIVVAFASTAATGDEPTEAARIKAAIVFNLTKVVTWPAESGTTQPFLLEVLGDRTLEPEFSSLDGKQVRGRKVQVRSWSSDSSAGSGAILFVSGSEKDRIEEALSRTAGKPVLTVSDLEGFCEKGGMIQFYEQRKKICLRINLRATRAAGLSLSSQLLRMAELVGEEG